MLHWILFALGAGVFFGGGWWICSAVMAAKLRKVKQRAEDILQEARKEGERQKKRLLIEAREEATRTREEFERKLRHRSRELEEAERRLAEKEKQVLKREARLSERETLLGSREKELSLQRSQLTEKRKELDWLVEQKITELQKVAQLSQEEAKLQLLENLRQKFNQDVAALYKEIKDKAKENAIREAKRIITMAIESIATDHTVESTVSVISLPSESIKGRIIGKDGRNIKAFEMATGVKIVVDDTPEAVVVSAFDPIKREVARLALEKLLADGKFYPQKIEEVVAAAKEELEERTRQAGTEALKEVGVKNVHPELVKLLGRLKYRTSYGQNVLEHSKEVAKLAYVMAAELGLDANLAKRAGLFHDIGKAVSQNAEGTHTQLGIELARKYGEDPVVVNAIASHHEDEEATSPVSVIVAAADAVSGSRPGARRETLEGYVRRVETLEKLADSFEGVAKAFAISAGREVRVIVEPDRISDAQADLLAADIAQKIQANMEYPGQIKVTVIRERRAVDYA